MGFGDSCLFFIFMWFCFQAQVLKSQNVSCNSKDLAALEGFLNGLDSRIDGWAPNSSFSSSSDCCNWVGVNCSGSSGVPGRRVVGLNLAGKGLKGNVSKLLSGLDQLKFLNLSSNSLRGDAPSDLFHLQQLQILDLSYNEFSGLIPQDAHLPAIRVFNVSDNSFTSQHPLLVGSLHLTHFIISYNRFSGNINPGICNSSTRIRVLQFSMNSFSGVFPAGFGNCSSLHELSLDSNNLTGNLPDDLFGVSTLRWFFLQDNGLSGGLSKRIGNLSNLVNLDLSYNQFTGIIPDVFSELKKLEYLSAESNNFSSNLPTSLLNLPTLRVLNLRNNSMEGEVNLNCTVMAHLSSINLGTNRFHGRILDNLSSCKELKTINLARNKLNGEIPNSLKNLQALSYLSLTSSNLSNISSALGILQQCRNLTTLVLTTNFHGEEMPIDGITGFASLKVLVIPNCGLLGSVPSWLRNCSQLQLLDLSWNRLGGSIPSWFGILDSLFYLDLSNNSLTGQIPESLTQLKGLIYSNASREVSSSNLPFFIRRSQSASVLQYNQFTSFPPTLDLNSNNLTGPIPPDFGKLKNLHVLNLMKNNLLGSIPDELSGMRSLEILDLSFNDLSGTIPATLTNLSFLSSFSVAHNRLSGPVPSGSQFSTFSMSSFEGNANLCGRDPLPPCQSQSPSPSRTRVRKNRTTISNRSSGGFSRSSCSHCKVDRGISEEAQKVELMKGWQRILPSVIG
ncbi:phytosulfokine receptor 1-like [Magnolia sinica]|uniref:phytosulfokine receptor 1-like n=1 Tax=Magnolia sinica TaxID=86752 RepID=UPI00265963F5|nr:phytosulfokine receptor 1-like [Magnolia sinica]